MARRKTSYDRLHIAATRPRRRVKPKPAPRVDRRCPRVHAEIAAYLEATFENMAQGVAIYDRDMRLVAYNRTARDMLTLPESLLRTRPTNRALREIYGFPESLFHKDTTFGDVIRFLAERGDLGPADDDTIVRDRVERHRRFVAHHVENRMADGKIIEVRGKPIPAGMVATYTDVTPRRRAENELRLARDAAEAASRAKSDFLANVSHELRTPLNAIIGCSEVMLARLFGPMPEKYGEYARDIHQSGTWLLTIINDLLDVAKIEAGRLELREAVMDLRDCIEQAMRIVRERADKAGLALRFECRESAARMWADPKAIRQILLNLLSNAIKFTRRGGTIAVALETASGRLRLAVRDTGIGIAAEDIAKVLAPFGQVAGPMNRRHQGTGLGLPLVKSLAELHGAQFSITSEFGRGTEVAIAFAPERLRAARADPVTA